MEFMMIIAQAVLKNLYFLMKILKNLKKKFKIVINVYNAELPGNFFIFCKFMKVKRVMELMKIIAYLVMKIR